MRKSSLLKVLICEFAVLASLVLFTLPADAAGHNVKGLAAYDDAIDANRSECVSTSGTGESCGGAGVGTPTDPAWDGVASSASLIAIGKKLVAQNGDTTPVATTAAAGGYADGWSVTEGATGDAACGTDNGTCSGQALLKRGNQRTTQVDTDLTAQQAAAGSDASKAVAIQGVTGGKSVQVKTDQTTHGTTDLVADDQTKIAGTTISVNSGTKDAGTQRVVLASDQDVVNVKPDNVIDAATGSTVFSSTGAQNGSSIASAGYGYIEFQTPGIGAGAGNLAIQFSNDGGTTWITGTFWRLDNASQSAVLSNAANTGQIYVAPIAGALIRFTLSAQTSGTTTVNYSQKRGAVPPQNTLLVTATSANPVAAAGTQAALSARSGNPVTGGCTYKTTTTAATTGQAQDLACDPYGAIAEAPYGPMQTAETAASATTGNTANVATLAQSAGKTTYITGFQCTFLGATSAATGTVAVGGVITGTMNYVIAFPAGVTLAGTSLIVSYPKPVPASAAATTITVTLPAAGAGNTYESCNAQGFQQ